MTEAEAARIVLEYRERIDDVWSVTLAGRMHLDTLLITVRARDDRVLWWCRVYDDTDASELLEYLQSVLGVG